MVWFLCEQLSLPSINHHRREGTWIRDAEHLWKMVMIMRSIPDKLPYWTRVVLYSSADIGCFTRDLDRGLSLLLSDSQHIWPCWQPFMYATAICWSLWRPLYLPANRGQADCWPCITAGNYFPKTRTVLGNDSHQSTMFSAMKRHCCCQHCFLRERMTRQWEWNGAMLYKEDYKDKTTFTSLKFEATSRETWRLSKSSCVLEGWQLDVLCALVNVMNRTENTDVEFLPLDSKADTWQKSNSQSGTHLCAQYKAPHSPPPSFSAEDIFFQCNTTNK